MSDRLILLLFPLLCFFFLLPAPARALDPADVVVAASQGETVTAGELAREVAYIQREKSLKTRPSLTTLEKLAGQILTRKLLARQALQAGLDRDPLLRYGIERERMSVLAKAELSRIGQDLDPARREILAKEYYQLNREKYSADGKRLLSHILISPSERSDAEAKALAERLAAELRKHPDRFASLVKRYSDDPGSRGKKGSLGWVSKKNLVEPFAKAAFALTRVGELSPVIKTRFGYHIIRLDGLPKGKTLSFDEVKAGIYPKVEEEYRRLKRMQYLDNLRASSQRTIERGAIRDLQSRLD